MYLLDRYRWRRAHRILMQDGLGFGLLSLLNRRIWSVANEILFDRKPCRGHLWVFSLCQDYQCSILLTFLSPYPSRSLAIYQCCSFETRYLGQFPKILRSNTRTESCINLSAVVQKEVSFSRFTQVHFQPHILAIHLDINLKGTK